MKRKYRGAWLPIVKRDGDKIFVEQPDGSFMQCDPFQYQIWLKGCMSEFSAAAWAKLTAVE